MNCETCKHFKRFNYGDGCEKKRKMLLEKEKQENQPCYEMNLGYDPTKDFFDLVFGKRDK